MAQAFTRSRCRWSKLFHIVAALIIVFSACTTSALAQPPKPPKSKAQQLEDLLHSRLAESWKLFYAGKYRQSAKLTQPLLKAPKEWARVQAAHC